jgi:hypothetical protein
VQFLDHREIHRVAACHQDRPIVTMLALRHRFFNAIGRRQSGGTSRCKAVDLHVLLLLLSA